MFPVCESKPEENIFWEEKIFIELYYFDLECTVGRKELRIVTYYSTYECTVESHI